MGRGIGDSFSPVLLLLSVVVTGPAAAQPTEHCVAAHQFMQSTLGMAAEVERDTIDDWRTGRKVVGCRVTAAGLSNDGVQRAAAAFYERLRVAGWHRTPDPQDAPNEASLRFRMRDTDCLFNVYRDAVLFTDAEHRVSEARVPAAGQIRYGVLAMCMPAMPAKPQHS